MTNAPYHLRKAEQQDAGTLQTLWVKTFEEAYEAVHSPDNIRAYCEANFSLQQAEAMLGASEYFCIIAEHTGAPVGFYILADKACPAPLEGASTELKQIYLRSSEYGAGLAARLFEHATDTARSQGNQWLWLSVSDKNLRAQAFYGKLGFVTVGTGPTFDVGSDQLTSTLLALKL